MLTRSPGKFLSVISNLITKKLKIRNVLLIFQTFERSPRNVKKIE